MKVPTFTKVTYLFPILLFDLYFSNTVSSKDENHVTTGFCVILSAALLTLFQNHFVKVSGKKKKKKTGKGGDRVVREKKECACVCVCLGWRS